MNWLDFAILIGIVLLLVFGHKHAEFGRRFGEAIDRHGGPGGPAAD